MVNTYVILFLKHYFIYYTFFKFYYSMQFLSMGKQQLDLMKVLLSKLSWLKLIAGDLFILFLCVYFLICNNFCLIWCCYFIYLFITEIVRIFVDSCFITCWYFLICSTVLWCFYWFSVLFKEIFPFNNDVVSKIVFRWSFFNKFNFGINLPNRFHRQVSYLSKCKKMDHFICLGSSLTEIALIGLSCIHSPLWMVSQRKTWKQTFFIARSLKLVNVRVTSVLPRFIYC